MKTQMPWNLINLSFAFALVLAIGSPAPSHATEPVEGKTKMEGKRMEGYEAMQKRQKIMMEDMKTQDAELTELVAKMNGAPTDKKMALMADIITKMVAQRVAMHERRTAMESEMMQQMMMHPYMGKESMTHGSMMDMKHMDEKPANPKKPVGESK